MVVPNTKCQHHSFPQGGLHAPHPTLGREAIGSPKRSLLACAELLRDGVERGHAGNVDFRVLDDFTVLDVKTADPSEAPAGRVIGGEELGDDRDLLRGVDCEPGTKERLIAHTVGVEVATVGVADTVVTVGGSVAFRAAASVLTLDGTGMSSVGIGDAVGFPDIHFAAAASVFACSAVGISRGRSPAFNIGLKYDKKRNDEKVEMKRK